MLAVAGHERIDVDILIVGAGPAGLSAALRLGQLQQSAGGPPLSVAVLEKAREVGGHVLSGAVLDPSALADLVPDFRAAGAPIAVDVRRDEVHFLTARRHWRLPFVPPPLSNHGHYLVSLSALSKWLASRVEAAGVDIFAGFAASELLYEGDAVAGVRTSDRGLDRRGQPRPTFEPGVEIRAKVTIVCDGVRGNLTKQLVRRFTLDAGRQPALYALGIKELWEVPADRVAPGTVIHTLGYPLRHEEFGGGFVYAMPDGVLSVGFVAGLDYRDPMFDPHVAFQRFKQHPWLSSLLRDGRLLRYGAKALPEGGWHTIPTLHVDGALLAGDAAGFLNAMRLKGIHLAMRTGMLAAEAAFDAVRAGDVSRARLASYTAAIDRSAVKRELYPARNVHQAFERGLTAGLAFSAWALVSRGWWFIDPLPARPGHERMATRRAYYGDPPPAPDESVHHVTIDRRLTFDRLTNVHQSGTRHREDQPSHLIVHDTDICRTRCREEYGNPCTRFCPAAVYEMVDDGQGGRRLQINASNCVHCKTCDILDPYQIVDWVPPEGGDGPQYEGM
jgi:electron-transferring-flavoprotein dehydrogenase